MYYRILHKFVDRLYIIFIIFGFLFPAISVHAQNDSRVSVGVIFTSISDVTLSDLLNGNPGEGLLLYSLSENNDLKLAVRLKNSGGSDNIAIAEVFELPIAVQNQDHSTITGQVLDKLHPKVILRSLDGRWLVNGKPSYNLDITLYGPSYSMWGSGYDPKQGFQSWAAIIDQDVLSVKIQVRDTNSDGLPDWDLRQLVPAFPGQGYLRTNYSERKCATPTGVDQGVFPAWPYVASSGGFEQAPGQFRPPIVVDWQTGKIIYFSELVTARIQNCSYTIYSIDPLVPGQINALNFETPFAFYDLSDAGVGFPNLILRTERSELNNRWQPAAVDPFERIRYSWREAVGDWLWDYKVEVMGNNPYTAKTSIAGGQYVIDAPAYDEFPGWVIQKHWPIVTFVDTEGHSYASSEGIYDWAPSSVGLDYYSGWVTHPDLEAFQNIPPGFRGEYRISEPAPVSLYFSPVDGRLHLLGAQAGLFNLDDSQNLNLYNLDGDAYLDGWARVRIPDHTSAQPTLLQGLFTLGQHALYFDLNQVQILQSSLPQSQFELLPPTDPASWQDFKRVMEQHASLRRDPTDLSTWLVGLGQQVMQVTNAVASTPEYRNGSYFFQLQLRTGFAVSGHDLFHLSGLAPGRYQVSYDGAAFHIALLTPPHLSLSLTAQPLTNKPGPGLYRLDVKAINAANLSAVGYQLLLSAACGAAPSQLLNKVVDIPGNGFFSGSVTWQPPVAETCTVSAALSNPSGASVAAGSLGFPASATQTGLSLQLLILSIHRKELFPLIVLLATLICLMGLVFYSTYRSLRKSC